MIRSLQDRARCINERRVIRAWEYRQRNYSKGVWFRLKRLLADAAHVFVIEERDADALEVRGNVPYPVGKELVPPKRIYIVERIDAADFQNAREIPARLRAELLAAKCLMVVRHETGRGAD